MAPIRKPRRERKAHFFRAWRDHAKLKQEDVEAKFGWSQSKASRIENLRTPFNQDDLEIAAEAYGCDVVDLLKTDPNDPDSIWRVLVAVSKAPKDVRDQVIAFAKFRLGAP